MHRVFLPRRFELGTVAAACKILVRGIESAADPADEASAGAVEMKSTASGAASVAWTAAINRLSSSKGRAADKGSLKRVKRSGGLSHSDLYPAQIEDGPFHLHHFAQAVLEAIECLTLLRFEEVSATTLLPLSSSCSSPPSTEQETELSLLYLDTLLESFKYALHLCDSLQSARDWSMACCLLTRPPKLALGGRAEESGLHFDALVAQRDGRIGLLIDAPLFSENEPRDCAEALALLAASVNHSLLVELSSKLTDKLCFSEELSTDDPIGAAMQNTVVKVMELFEGEMGPALLDLLQAPILAILATYLEQNGDTTGFLNVLTNRMDYMASYPSSTGTYGDSYVLDVINELEAEAEATSAFSPARRGVEHPLSQIVSSFCVRYLERCLVTAQLTLVLLLVLKKAEGGEDPSYSTSLAFMLIATYIPKVLTESICIFSALTACPRACTDRP